MVPTVNADHQDWISEAESGKTKQGHEEQNHFPKSERVHAD
jgi:hypothetical protein